MRLGALAALAFLTGAGNASAQWMTQKDDNPFEKTKSRWVFTAAAPSYGFGFACAGPDLQSAKILFITAEEIDAGSAAVMSQLSPEIAVIIDDGERFDVPASVDTVKIESASLLRLSASGEDAIKVAQAVGAARRRVSVAVTMVGQVLHPKNFGVSGSKRQIEEAIAACGIDATNRPPS